MLSTYPPLLPLLLPYLDPLSISTLATTHRHTATHPYLTQHLHHLRLAHTVLTQWQEHTTLQRVFRQTFWAPLLRHYRIPVLKYHPSLLGKTHEFDNLHAVESRLTHPLMVGMDPHHRPFVCVRYRLCAPSSPSSSTSPSSSPSSSSPTVDRLTTSYLEDVIRNDTRDRVLVLFQRYTNDPRVWMRAGHHYNPLLWGSRTRLNPGDHSLALRNVLALMAGDDVWLRVYQREENGGRFVEVRCAAEWVNPPLSQVSSPTDLEPPRTLQNSSHSPPSPVPHTPETQPTNALGASPP